MAELTLGEKQRLFTRLIGLLIAEAYRLGYELTFGEALRTQAQAITNATKGVGISNSLHLDRLAVDFNLFKDGVYLKDTSAHEPLGLYWESLHPLCAWGGRFGDGNHYSLQHGGRK